MTRAITIALVAIACYTTNTRADDKASSAVQKILDKSVSEVRRNLQTFRNANIPSLGTAKQELQDLATRLIEDGKSKEAQAVLKQVDTLEADVMRLANAPQPMPVARPVPQRPLLERMAGKWTHPNCIFEHEITSSGVVKEFKKSGELNADGKLRPTSSEEAETRLSNGYVIKFQIYDDDAMVMRAFKPDGGEFGEGFLKIRVR